MSLRGSLPLDTLYVYDENLFLVVQTGGHSDFVHLLSHPGGGDACSLLSSAKSVELHYGIFLGQPDYPPEYRRHPLPSCAGVYPAETKAIIRYD
jgi:hypothetical protein